MVSGRTPSMVLLAMVRERYINQLAFYYVSGGYLPLRVKEAAGSSSPYERLSETMVTRRGSWLVVMIACKTCFTLVNDPDHHIRMAHVDCPDVLWSGCVMEVVRMSMFCKSLATVVECWHFVGVLGVFLGLWSSSNEEMSGKKTVSSARASEAREKATDKLDVKEFQDRFCIPNGVVVQGIPPLLPDSTCLHSSQHRPGADGMQHHQHVVQSRPHATGGVLSLFPEEGKNDIFSMSAHLPSLQLVTELPDSIKGGAKGLVVVRGGWAGLLERPSRPFSPNYSLMIPGPEKRGHIVDWVEKASFVYVNKLFEIDAKERHYKTLLSARNLMAVVRESQDYVVNILPRKLPKEVVPGEHYTVKELPIYQEAKES
ncbi:hypothetical protein CK203_013857 [Vitis vinifera]|uniref:Uncharacterized protein n=1 Tax=Vitis vinifera TaxID=29760 RepID=A0A438JJC8_VITVI|nr:hypothetical protein CK203_013857 [Vitis vinifera]